MIINSISQTFKYLETDNTFNYYEFEKQYPTQFNNFHELDFYNFTFQIDEEVYTLKDSIFSIQYDPFGYESLSISSIYTLYNDSDSVNYAIVDLRFITAGGSSSEEGIVILFSINKTHLMSNFLIKYNPQKSEFIESERIIKLYSYKFVSDDPMCCPSLIEIGNFKIIDKLFELMSLSVIKNK